MKMSDAGRQVLTEREGVRLTAYRDSVGVWTIGVGHTAAAGKPRPVQGMTITDKEADEIFARDLEQYEQAVEKALKRTPLPNHFDAYASFAFNVGASGMARSTSVKLFNEGDVDGAAKALMKWVKPPELTSRRRGEAIQLRNAKVMARIESEAEFNRYLAEPVFPANAPELDTPVEPEGAPATGRVARNHHDSRGL